MRAFNKSVYFNKPDIPDALKQLSGTLDVSENSLMVYLLSRGLQLDYDRSIDFKFKNLNNGRKKISIRRNGKT